ncbi:hypothetical protein PALB_11830 [Pseudoalteromonas luteoviolacea B = ATCC 29581]|nr:hypothetical protein PALB_11830 [Pseudoalteromonas luteoviolacea B = ATCC 29581]
MRDKGFTLIELLISLIILASLMTIASTAYRQYISYWQKSDSKFVQTYETYKGIENLRLVLTGLMPHVVRDSRQSPFFFFVGSANNLLGITRNGLFDSRFPEVFRISFVNDESGKSQLIYQATSLKHFQLLKVDQTIHYEHSVVLLPDVSDISFSYVGYDSLEEATSADGQPKEFKELYSGIDKRLLPTRINLMLWLGKDEVTISADLHEKSYQELSPYFEVD